MTTSADQADTKKTPTEEPPQRKPGSAQPMKAVIGVVGIVITLAVVGTAFQAMQIYDMPRILQAVVAILAGVGGAGLIFYFINQLVEALPLRLSLKVIPYAFLLPAFGLLIAFLIYPTVQTIIYSFANDTSTEFVGFDNYTYVFGDDEFRGSGTSFAAPIVSGIVAQMLHRRPAVARAVGIDVHVEKPVVDQSPQGRVAVGYENSLTSNERHREGEPLQTCCQ